MALTPRPRPSISAGIETGRLGGRVRAGSRAAHRKAFTQSTRDSMQDIIRKYRQLINRLRTATPEIMLDAMRPVFEKSQEYCPVKTGLLVSTGNLRVAKQSGNRVQVVITYGSSAAWYAPIVHERTDLNHEYPTRAKFLQSAMEEEFDNFLVSLAFGYAEELKA